MSPEKLYVTVDAPATLNSRLTPPPNDTVPKLNGPLPTQVTVQVPFADTAVQPGVDMVVVDHAKEALVPLAGFGTAGPLIRARLLRCRFSAVTVALPLSGSVVAAFLTVTVLPAGAWISAVV